MKAIKFFTLNGQWKSMMITDKALILSNKKYDSLEAMIPSLTGTAVLEDKEEIWYQSLEEINFLTNGENVILKRFDFRNNPILTTVIVNDIEIINDLVEAMSQEETFIRTEEKANTFRVAKVPLFSAILTGVFTGIMFFTASGIANGQGISLNGKKSFFKVILIGIVDVIGATGVLLIGIGLTLFFLYKLMNKLKNPPSLIRMKRVKK